MSRKNRLKKLEEAFEDEVVVPILTLYPDGRGFAAGRETTLEAWREEYREQLKRTPPGRITVLQIMGNDE